MRNKRKLAAFIVALVTTIIVGLLTIPAFCFPLVWMLPLTFSILYKYKKERRASPAYIMWITILMVNPAIAILLLTSENKYTRRRWCYDFALLQTILCGVLILPLAWMIPFTVKLNKASSAEWDPTTGFKVCLLIFFGPVPLSGGKVMSVLLFTEPKGEDY